MVIGSLTGEEWFRCNGA